jgi:hypothetical protein
MACSLETGTSSAAIPHQRRRPAAVLPCRSSAPGGAPVTLCHGGARELRGGSGPAEPPKGRRSADNAAKPSRHSRPARCLYHAKPRAPALLAGRHHAHDPRASEITRGWPVNGRGEVAGLALRLTLSRVDAEPSPAPRAVPTPCGGSWLPEFGISSFRGGGRRPWTLSGKSPAVAKSPMTAAKLPATPTSAVAMRTLVGDFHRRAAGRGVCPTALRQRGSRPRVVWP